jgi:glycerol-3-phosphate dehydrogenase
MTGQEWEVKAKSVINATGVFADAIRCVSPPSPILSL